MQDLKDIPDAVRWRFAAECAAKLPALYDIAFREALGKKYDALEQEIWMELARMVRDIVHDCSLPFRNAQEIARSYRSRSPSSSGRSMAAKPSSSLRTVQLYWSSAARS